MVGVLSLEGYGSSDALTNMSSNGWLFGAAGRVVLAIDTGECDADL